MADTSVHSVGSEWSIWDRTMLKLVPAAMVYDITCLLWPILRSESVRMAVSLHRFDTYQVFSCGFSSSHAMSGSLAIFSTGTVALYAAKPVTLGASSLRPVIAWRAWDLIPCGLVSGPLSSLTEVCNTVRSNDKVCTHACPIRKDHSPLVRVVVVYPCPNLDRNTRIDS